MEAPAPCWSKRMSQISNPQTSVSQHLKGVSKPRPKRHHAALNQLVHLAFSRIPLELIGLTYEDGESRKLVDDDHISDACQRFFMSSSSPSCSPIDSFGCQSFPTLIIGMLQPSTRLNRHI